LKSARAERSPVIFIVLGSLAATILAFTGHARLLLYFGLSMTVLLLLMVVVAKAHIWPMRRN
jgi:hypothetical protein